MAYEELVRCPLTGSRDKRGDGQDASLNAGEAAAEEFSSRGGLVFYCFKVSEPGTTSRRGSFVPISRDKRFDIPQNI
jgi:hypothetical protein